MTLTTGTRAAGFHIGKSIMRKLLLVFAALMVTLPASAAGRYGYVRGGFFVGPGFGPWDYGYGPYWGGYPMLVHPNAGQIKLDTKVKDAEIYIDGAYAGTVKDLKSMWLRQGAYNLEVRSADGTQYAQRIYIVNGKTTHIHPEFTAPEPKS